MSPCVSPVRWVLLFSSFDREGNRDVNVFPIMAHSWQMAGPLSLMPPLRRGRGGLRRVGVWDRDGRRGHAWAAGLASPRHCLSQAGAVPDGDQIVGMRQELVAGREEEVPRCLGQWQRHVHRLQLSRQFYSRDIGLTYKIH